MRSLLWKEWVMEFRQKETLLGVGMYLLSTVYVCYLSFQRLERAETWNALLWIIVLFSAFHAMARTFRHERPGVMLYLYTTVSPQALIAAKLIFNGLYMLVLSVLTVACMVLFLGQAVFNGANTGGFFLALFIGSLALAGGLTLISGIAVKTGHNMGLSAVLAFPVIIPVLVVLRDITLAALAGVSTANLGGNLLLLVGICALVVGMAYLLFPYLWRE